MGLEGKRDAHSDSSTVGSGAVPGLKCLRARPGVVCVQRPSGLGSSAKVCCRRSGGGGRRKHGATRWQIYDWRRRFRQRGELPSREAPQPPFAPLVVDGPLEERHAPAVKLEIAIGDVVVRTDAAMDGEQLSRLSRAVRASR